MKIGFVLDDSLDRPDGVQQYVLTLGKWLESKGHKIYYLVGETKRTDIAGVHSLGRTLRVKFNGNVVGTPLPVRKAKIVKLLDSLKLDVLHVQLPYSPVLAGRIVREVNERVVVVGTLHIYPNSKFEHGLNWLLAVVNKNTLARFDKITAVSLVAARASHLPNFKSIDVIPNPVDTQNFQNATHSKHEYRKIVFLGRLVPRKGCQQLLEAIVWLKNENKLLAGWKVEVGGTGPLLPKLKKYVAKNGLSNTVTFKGFVNETDKPSFLANADIAVYPSSGGESFGIVLIEAMAAKTMVLAGNNPGYAGVMGINSSELFNTKSGSELGILLAGFMSSASRRKAVVAKQAELVKAYDIEVVGEQIQMLYTKTLHSRNKMG